jgi:hypothetical protein
MHAHILPKMKEGKKDVLERSGIESQYMKQK